MPPKLALNLTPDPYPALDPTFNASRRRGRLFQFAAKYWFGCSASLVGILWLSQDVPSLRPWNPLYVIFTMVVILSEKVLRLVACHRYVGR